jgi:hypothetical protein
MGLARELQGSAGKEKEMANDTETLDEFFARRTVLIRRQLHRATASERLAHQRHRIGLADMGIKANAKLGHMGFRCKPLDWDASDNR